MKKFMFATLLLMALLLTSSFLQAAMADDAMLGLCDSKCKNRCAKAGIMDRCLKYCGICCKQCNCVPSGTYGNKHECPCYRDKKNSKGKPKCP
ncbi:peamaclein-like [Telopea speciosissima]|uniref:peamaclein-like n=1 Tax=Telopea speciosissima TaxID=54955 RepID=UPI001CC6ACAA|nr:peamaclein-like [Telopea speciosissima]